MATTVSCVFGVCPSVGSTTHTQKLRFWADMYQTVGEAGELNDKNVKLCRAKSV